MPPLIHRPGQMLTDSRKNWRPDRFGYELCGCKVELIFPTAKLLDYGEHWDDLEKSDNPFSVVVMAHLKHLETHRNMDNRLKWKSSLVKMLYQWGMPAGGYPGTVPVHRLDTEASGRHGRTLFR
ncbi:hypothetical protein [Desulfatirhabdium butyrativorans]|uniref:hypothetical protein n=1 Tax=Desulfatirhabdium butyrativorans TaxID=340467 RepID=UPI0003F59067|nr:hypothetical protein [Desulfatirhabdium butyrativorans]